MLIRNLRAARVWLAVVGCGLGGLPAASLAQRSLPPESSSRQAEAPAGCWTASGAVLPAAPGSLRIATFNVALFRATSGTLAADLVVADDQLGPGGSDGQDFDAEGEGLRLFQQRFLGQSQNGQPPLRYDHVYSAPSNTGVPTGLDLDGDGRSDGPADAMGYGQFPGQYGMAVLSRVPLGPVRTFRTLLWSDIP